MRFTCPRLFLLPALAALLLTLPGCVSTLPEFGGPGIAAAGSHSKAYERSVALLQSQARAADPAVRANCIEALQNLQDPRATDVIEQGLHDPEWIVRFSAAMSAGKRQEFKFKPVLVNRAASDPNDSVRVAAVYALRRLGDATNMNLLARTLNDPDPTTRANTALVLGLLGEPSALPLLQLRRTETNSIARMELTAAMARLGDTAAMNALVAMSLSRYTDSRLLALATVGDVAKPETANVLLAGLRDPSPEVQLVAARTCAKLGSIEGGNLAVNYLKSSEPGLRSLAVLALGEILVIKGEPRLSPKLDDPDPAVQRATAAAIVNLWFRAEAKLEQK
jgi:hypothetical protein